MFFLIIIIPFTYLESNKMNVESYSNYNQIMNSSLDIFFTNQNNEKRQMDMLEKVKLINNPIQTVLVQKDIIPITLYVITKNNSPIISISLFSKEQNMNIYSSYTNEIVMTYITIDDLYKKNYNYIKDRVKTYNNITDLKNAIDFVPSLDSYILVTGNNIGLFTNANQTLKNSFINDYRFSWLNTLSSSSGSFITIISKTTSNYIVSYTKLSEKYTPLNNFLVITQNLTSDMTLASQYGQEFNKVATSEDFEPITNNPLINSKINIISPANANIYSTLSFTYENNTSFVYLSSRKLEDQVVLYSKSPKTDIGPVSNTYLDTERPQFWSFEPVTQIVTTPIVVIIRTYTKPYYYLDVEMNNGIAEVKINRLKAALKQHWELIRDGTTGTIYKIRHILYNKYLAYSDYDGYLYKDSGSVFLTNSDKYSWNITGLNINQINKNVIETFTPNMNSSMKNPFQGLEVPTDYGTVENPSYELSGEVNGKNIVIESQGRTLWESDYSLVWNGKWIYYGTVLSYKATLDLNKVKFLLINVDNNGNGQVEDEYLNYKMKVINAGSNILTGVIPSGEYKGFRAILKLLPTDLKYTDPSKPYPVKMRYIIQKDIPKYANNSPSVTGIATQYQSIGTGASTSNLWYSSWCSNLPNSVCNAEYRVIFSNGVISDKEIQSNSPSGLTNPDILFAIDNVKNSNNNIKAILQGRKINTTKWYDVDVPSQNIPSGNSTIKFSGNTGNFKSDSSFFSSNIRHNLSSGNIYNMEGYSTKFDGNKIILSNFLEASGIQTNPNLAFSPENLQKINANIKEQTSIPPIIQKVSSQWMTTPIKSTNLLYKASNNGWNVSIFHQLCDNKGPTITIAKLQNGGIIGAYSPISWGLNSGYIYNMETFLFDNNTKYTTAQSAWGPGQYAIYQGSNYGPTFGGGFDFSVNQSTLTNNAFTYSNNGKGPLGVSGPPSYSYNNYQLIDLEVYSITT